MTISRGTQILSDRSLLLYAKDHKRPFIGLFEPLFSEQNRLTNSSPPSPQSNESKANASLNGLLEFVSGRPFRIAFKILVVFLVCTFLGLTIWRAYKELQGQTGLQTHYHYGYFALALVTGIAALIPACVAWIQALHSFGQRFPLIPACDAYYLGHLGKYVPGKAMVLVLRVGKLQPLGVQLRPAIVSVFVETLTGLGMASILGAVMLFFSTAPDWLRWTGVASVPFALCFLAPHFFRLVLFALAKSKLGRIPKDIPAAFTWRFMLRTCGWMTIGCLFQGTVGWLLMLAIYGRPEVMTPSAWVVAVASVSLGNVAGFVSMLPGGAGVREVVVTWLLSPLLTPPVALVFAVYLRLINLCSEAISVAVLTLVRRRYDAKKKIPKATKE
jgi:glycosyltransferase 2 family protein